MPTLIFDIETVGEEWSALDETTKHVLERWAERSAKTVEERQVMQMDIETGLGFSPLTGRVVAIGVYDLERSKGVVYYEAEAREDDEEIDGYTLKVRTEKEMLEEFWEGAKHYDTFVTFNGRGFDVPFLLHRSVVRGVRPTKNLMEGRYAYQQRSCRHVDLQDELTFYGAMSKRPSLHLFCRAYGITSPKEEASGDDVAVLFASKKFRDIAVYNAKDVTATTALYEMWQNYLTFNGKDKEINY